MVNFLSCLKCSWLCVHVFFFLLTYPPAYLLTFLITYPPAFLLNYLPTYLLTYLPSYSPTHCLPNHVYGTPEVLS